MKLQAIRHATQMLIFNGKRLLIDPVLSGKGSMTAIAGVPNTSKNPLTELPVPTLMLLDVDAVLITHTHRDHFDDAAADQLPKTLPIFCQPQDEVKIKAKGFTNVIAVYEKIEWNGIAITRTGGRHGHGITAIKMAPVSGYVLYAKGEPCLYITGDTVWCSAVSSALQKQKPDIVVCYCGAAKFEKGRHITMGTHDVLRVCQQEPNAKVVAVHMEAWNHCRLTRHVLREFVKENKLNVVVPENGELLSF